MRVLVMGAGGVGGYYGSMLALREHEVTFVARGDHLAAMRERGLEVRSEGRTYRLQPVRVVAAPAEACPERSRRADDGFDLVLFTVKTYDTEAAAAALRPVVGPKTAVLTLQNGVDSVEQLSAALGAEHVLAGSTQIETTIAEPGVVDHRSTFRKIWFGEPSGQVTPRVEAIAAALREAGAEVTVSPDPIAAIWEKFVRLAAGATLTTVCQAPVGHIREIPEGKALYQTLFAEVVAVARATGVALPPDVLDTALAAIMSYHPTMGTSMQRDFERHNRVELEQLVGTVVRRGRALGVPTPTFDVLYSVLKIRALTFGGLS